MLVPLEGYQQAWRRIKQESMSHSTYRLVIFVSCMDVDAFAAAMMLGSLLKKHLILYKTEPVVGYESLKRGFSRLDPSIRNVFLVGCGSNIDLEEFFQLEDENNENGEEAVSKPRPKIHVFDRNRPWNLNNLYGNDFIYCYDDGSADQLEPYKEAYMFLASQPDPETNAYEDEHENGDNNNNNDDNNNKEVIGSDDDRDDGGIHDTDNDTDNEESGDKRRHKVIDSDSEAENTQEDDEQIEDAAKEPSGKRRRTQATQKTQMLEEYYQQGSHITSTSAVAVYTLLTLIGETSSRMLWLTIIGATSIEAQHPQLYRLLLPSLQDEMRRLNQTENNNHEGSAASTRSIRFSAEPDYSLFLLRQWSLYESMVHSSYVSAKLFLWREDGRKKLHKMLARVGITLQDAKETWIHTKPSMKRELKSKLDSISGYYGIEGITRDGVVRQFGLKGTMSAGDCVESIAAFLETGKSQRGPIIEQAGMSSGLSAGAAHNGSIIDDGSQTGEDLAVSESWVRNFWTAWDAVDSYDRLRLGAEQAKALQRSVVATANFIFDKNLPKDLHSFRMVIVQEAPDIEVFLNPLSLQRLAIWISEGCAEIHTSNIPLVLAVLNEQRNVYLVFGIAGHRSRDQNEDEIINSGVQNNFFGRLFQETAVEINARIRVDAFDSSIIEVSREDLPRFLEALDIQIRGI